MVDITEPCKSGVVLRFESQYFKVTTKHTPLFTTHTPLFTTRTPPPDRSSDYSTGFSSLIIITTRTRSQPLYLPTTHPTSSPPWLAPPSVGELYVSHEKLILAANTWAGAHGYALNIKRSNTNKRGIKDKIWLKCDRGGKYRSPVGQIYRFLGLVAGDIFIHNPLIC